MKQNQIEAIKQLEAALLRVKRCGLVMVGVDDTLFATVADDALQDEISQCSGVEAILARANNNHESTEAVKHYGVYLDSGGA